MIVFYLCKKNVLILSLLFTIVNIDYEALSF